MTDKSFDDSGNDDFMKLGNVCGTHYVCPSSSKNFYHGGLRTKNINKTKLDAKEIPLVTVITAVLNKAGEIEKTIKSVLDQTYNNIEYIIIDGGSTDGTLDIIKKYDSQIDYYVSENDRGIYYALNKGLSLSLGRYILCLNSDDWITSDAIELSMSALLKNDADYSVAYEYIINGNIQHSHTARFFSDIAFLGYIPCAHGTMLVSRKAYELIGYYDTTYRSAADFKMQILLIKHELKYSVLDKHIHYHSVGVTPIDSRESSLNQIEEVKRIVREFYPDEFNVFELESIVRFLISKDKRSFVLNQIYSILPKEVLSENQRSILQNLLANPDTW